jgi:flagellar motor switch protein FliG
MSEDSRYRKAAILVSALDAETAELLFAEMPSDIAQSVRRAVSSLDEIDAGEQQTIIDEFVRLGALSPEIDPPGLELTDDLAARLAYRQSAREQFDAPASSHHSGTSQLRHDFVQPPHQSFQSVDPGLLASALESEQPQIIGAVIANLPAQRAGEVLARLPSGTQAEVIRRLSGLEPARPEVLAEIQQLVMARVGQLAPAAHRASGLATVSTILNSTDEAARRQILSNLARHDRPLAGRLKPPKAALPRFSFEDVCRLDTDGLLRVVEAAPPETVVLAFAGANAELVSDLVDCLPSEQSQRFARGIAELGPTRLADIEAAQSSLADLASQLAAEDRLHGGPPIHLTAVA